MDDVLEAVKKKPQADESLGERSVLQVDAVIELVEVVFGNFILETGFPTEGGEAVESSLSSVRINIFVENFELMAIARSERLTYVDDTCVIWKHVMDNLQLFMEHINNLQMTINFTKQLEYNGSVPFCLSWSLRRDQFWNNIV